MNERYLPIGSVVELKNGKKIMVIGYYSVEYDNDIVVYDYSGCAYPEGIMLKSSYCSFNHNDIKKVDFVGYVEDAYLKLNKTLNIIDNDLVIEDDIEEQKLDDNNVDLLEIEKLEPVNELESINYDTLESINYDTLESNKKEEKEKKEEFVIPHYEFDESGIIIKD